MLQTLIRVLFGQIIPVTYPMGQGEPINAVISGHSDERVLKDQEREGGLRNYFMCVAFLLSGRRRYS